MNCLEATPGITGTQPSNAFFSRSPSVTSPTVECMRTRFGQLNPGLRFQPPNFKFEAVSRDSTVIFRCRCGDGNGAESALSYRFIEDRGYLWTLRCPSDAKLFCAPDHTVG